MNTNQSKTTQQAPVKARIKWGTLGGEPAVKLASEQQWRSHAMKKGWRTRRRRAKLAGRKFNGIQVAPVAANGSWLNRPAKEMRRIAAICALAAKLRRKLEQTLAPYV